MSSRRATLALALAALATLAPGVAGAAAVRERTSLPALEDEVMCVVCNVPLGIAGAAPQAVEERALILRLVARGLDKRQVKAALVAQYGPAVLADPGTHGFGLAAYVVPPVLLALAVALLAALLPRWRRRSRAPALGTAGAGIAPDPADAQRLDEELARYDA